MFSASSSFTGPQYYEDCLGPLWFEHFAADLANRLPRDITHVLEIACGTGIVTRRLHERLGRGAHLVATDVSKPMLEYAREKTGPAAIEWRQADGLRLPFG